MKNTTLVFLSIALWIAGEPAHASAIIYTEQAVASGSLGSVPFSRTLVTLVFTGDTANVMSSLNISGDTVFSNFVGIATVTVSGIGSATFTENVGVLNVQLGNGSGVAGFARPGVGPTLLEINDPALSTYALDTPIGPITSQAECTISTGFDACFPANTDLGFFFLDVPGPGDSATFTATADVPESSSVLLLAIGMIALCGFRLTSQLRNSQFVRR
jgi:hypothetical protein